MRLLGKMSSSGSRRPQLIGIDRRRRPRRLLLYVARLDDGSSYRRINTYLSLFH